jgi:peroxiredoxin
LKGSFSPNAVSQCFGQERIFLYLGLSSESRYFSISEISGDYVLIEVYNEMCTLCLKELPNINRLFELVDADGELRQRVKILGLGAGSTRRSVAGFRKKTGYDFPLFADEKWQIFGLLGKPTLPVLYLMEKDGVNGLRILLRHEGGIGNPEDFLVHLKRRIDQEDALKKDNTKP